MNDPLEQFRHAIHAAGITPPDVIYADGVLRRFSTSRKPDDDAGWYVYHGDDIPAGAFGDWRTGLSKKWRADVGRRLSHTEEQAHRLRMETLARQRKAEEVMRNAEARREATRIWAKASPCTMHPYLSHKHVSAHGTRLYKNLLVVPLQIDNIVHSLQLISPNCEKKFLTGGQVKGCYFMIGNPNGAATLYVAEGFATSATIHEVTGYPVAVAFNAHNLKAVAKAMRERFPATSLAVCADDDHATRGNPGLAFAKVAAHVVGGIVAVPVFGTNRPDGATDFNDMSRLCGVEAVRQAIVNARAL
jgi:putative DNA primase/helicase